MFKTNHLTKLQKSNCNDLLSIEKQIVYFEQLQVVIFCVIVNLSIFQPLSPHKTSTCCNALVTVVPPTPKVHRSIL